MAKETKSQSLERDQLQSHHRVKARPLTSESLLLATWKPLTASNVHMQGIKSTPEALLQCDVFSSLSLPALSWNSVFQIHLMFSLLSWWLVPTSTVTERSLLLLHQYLFLFKRPSDELSTVVPVYNPSILGAEAGGWEVQSCPELYRTLLSPK